MQRDRVVTAAYGVALVALVAWSAWTRWQMLAVSPFPLGVDGYFYPVQVRALLETGALQYPSSPLTFWWIAPFAAATDPITGTKLAAALGCALVALPAFGVAMHLTRMRGAALVAATVASLASTSTYLTTEFVKQGIGITVALTAIWLVLRALASPTCTRIALAIAAIVATALTHKLAAGFVLVLAAPAAFEQTRARGKVRGRRLLYALLIAVVTVVVVLVVGIVAPQRFLSPADVALVRDALSSTARWDAPALVTPMLTLAFDHEAAIGGIVALVAAVVVALRIRDRDLDERRTPGARMVAWGFIVLGLAIALPWLAVDNPQGLGFRLRVTAFVPLAMCTAILAATAARFLAGWQRDVALVLLAVILARAPHTRDEGRVLVHPAMVSAVMAAASKIPPRVTVIVPERHILFMTAWYTRAPVALRPELVPPAQRVRLVPLAFIGMGSPLDQALDAARADPHVAEPPLGVHPRHRNGLVLLAEPTWEHVLASLPADVRAFWARWSTI